MAKPVRSIGASKGGFTHTDNNHVAFKAKVTVRQNVMAAIGEASVFDAFAGSGAMYSAVWKDAAFYTGCDQKPQTDSRLMFCADNRRVLRAIDLAQFNVFDLDAYGFPWEAAVIIGDRRHVKQGETIGLVLTEAAGMSYQGNTVPTIISMLTGVRNRAVVGLGRLRSEMFDRTIAGLVKRMGCTVEKRWQAMATMTGEGLNRRGTGMKPIYCGLILKGL